MCWDRRQWVFSSVGKFVVLKVLDTIIALLVAKEGKR